MDKPTAKAIVTLSVEVAVGASWGKDCTIEQVHEQASREARGKLRNALGEGSSITILTDPLFVDTVITRNS